MNNTTLPTNAKKRKKIPLARGLLDYFPNALAEVAMLSLKASEQHGHGNDMHWEYDKSNDHADCILRHMVDRGTIDSDGIAHSTKVAWRALAMLEAELIEAGAKPGRSVRMKKRDKDEIPEPPDDYWPEGYGPPEGCTLCTGRA